MLSKLAPWKISGALRLVIKRVLLGVAGWERDGRLERSRESDGEWRRFMPVEGVERGDIVMAAMSSLNCSVGVIGTGCCSPFPSSLLLLV